MKKLLLLSFLSSAFYLLSSNAFAQQGEWTWMKGSSFGNQSGTYGTMGVSDPANTPPGLYEPYEWTDKQGNLWLFGGYDGLSQYRNTLWKYDPSTNEWTWMNGSSAPNPLPVFGTMGVPAATNDPGGRFSGATWVDTAGNFWLFGGFYSVPGIGSDLWKYDISSNEWTWMKGPTTSNAPGVYGSQGVEDAANYPGYRCEINAAWTDDNNNLWMFGGGDNGGTSYNDLWRFNPTTNNWTWMKGSNLMNMNGVYGTIGVPDPANTPGARMIYTRWKDLSGNFWLYGGRNSNWNVFNDLWKYDVATNEWTWMSGTSNLNAAGNYGALCVADSAYISSNRTENRAVWTDACGNFWFFGGANNYYGSYYSDLWKYVTSSDKWILAEGSSTPNQNGTYGTQGVADPANIPPGLWGSSSWTDHDGNFWLFGGCALWVDFRNALWKYVPDSACGGCAVQSSQVGFASSDTDICQKFCISYFDSSSNNPTSWLWLFPGGNPSTSTNQNPLNICYNLPGIYDVTLITTSATGTDTLTLSNYITVYATPPFPTISQVGYTLTSSPAVSYQWQLNAADIPGATNQSYTILQTGYYTVVVTDSNNCKNSVTEYILISGLNDVMSDANISIYPNPSDGNFMVELLNGFMAGEISIDVVNVIGQKVFSSKEKISSAHWTKQIDLSKGLHSENDIAHGVYFIEIKTESEYAGPDFFGVRKKIVIAD
ncbi:MAG TPA: kelch repeat-containing protein [Chitinophagales bacterium]|nr:kelch repeat-containing protein [Chitinophagales bacterium]